MASETHKTLEECKRRGWIAQKTEYWLPSFRVHDVVNAANELVAKPSRELLDDLEETLAQHKSNPGVRKDLLGFIDVLAIVPGERLVAIQCTSKTNIAARVNKILASDLATEWLTVPCCEIEVWGWFRREQRVNRRLWDVETRIVVLPDKPF